MRHLIRRSALLLTPVLLVLGLAVGTAHAAVTGTVNPATVGGSDFTWTCDVNPGGATIYVTGRSWYDPARPGAPAVDTPRQQISGTTTQRLTFTRDGDPQTAYGYRCLWFSSPTTTTVLGKTASALYVTTKADTLFGSNVDLSGGEAFAQALARQDAAYGPRILRIFWSGLPSTSCAQEKNALDRPTVQSWKGDPAQLSAGAYNATLNAWFACFDRPTRVTFFHEPENDFTTETQKTAYRNALRAFALLAEAHPNHANLVPIVILMDYTLLPASGRGDWRGWYDPAVDEVWWDLYSFKEENASTTDDELMAAHQTLRPSLAASRSVGKPYGIAELGYDKPSNRPAFLTDAAAWARTNNITGFCYFDSIGTLGDHRLTDAASRTAWRNAIAG